MRNDIQKLVGKTISKIINSGFGPFIQFTDGSHIDFELEFSEDSMFPSRLDVEIHIEKSSPIPDPLITYQAQINDLKRESRKMRLTEAMAINDENEIHAILMEIGK